MTEAQAPELDQSVDPVAVVFGRGGLLAKTFEGYEPRRGQVELAYAIHEVFERGGNLLAEAPTGTGKSVAYLVPAAFQAAERAKRTVVVTANIALQEQLVGKDLPMLSKVLPWRFTFALAKGIGNYLCRDVFEDSRMQASFEGFDDPREAEQWAEAVSWSERTLSGDLSELSFEAAPAVRLKLATSSEDCTGKLCGFYNECFAMRARAAYKAAHVVVTNYHLFFADLVIKRGGAEGVLPAYDLVVFDEGHKAADVARDWLGFKVTPYAVRRAVRHLNSRQRAGLRKGQIPVLDERLQRTVFAQADALFESLGAYFRSDEYEARLRKKEPVVWHPLHAALVQSAKVLTDAVASVCPVDRRPELVLAAGRCASLAADLKRAMMLEDDGRVVYFCEPTRSAVALASKPLKVSDWLREELFDHGSVKGVVVTSATLTAAGSFDFLAGELGAETAEELSAPSPFDWPTQALVVVPEGLPEPNDKRFGEKAAEVLIEVVTAAKGRTLGLFTSYKNLELAHRRLLDAGLPYPLMRQGDAPRTQLVRRFASDVSSVLLGTESFWQGVDVPGEALSCLVIDRLPFETPDDPIVDCVAARDPKNWFRRWAVPRAIISFRQGVGRLIRARTDRGVVVVLDRRIVDKGYGKLFLRSLPEGIQVTRRVERIGEFLR